MADFGVCNVLGKLIIFLDSPYFLSILSGQTPSAMFYCAYQAACYLAPEVLSGDEPHISTSADMWSLGAVLTYIANNREHLFRRERDVFNWRDGRTPMRRQFQYPLHDLVLSLLSVDKHSRPTAMEVLQDQMRHKERRDS